MKVVIVSSSDKGPEFVADKLGKNADIERVKSCAEAEKLVADNYDLIIINAPAKGGGEMNFAAAAAKKFRAGVLIMLPAGVYAENYMSLARKGVFAVKKPILTEAFLQSLAFVLASDERLKGFAEEKETLKEKVEETKLVSRAKLLLVQKLAFSEEEAHKYIERRAMDLCVKRSVVAEDIIKTYKND